MRLRPVPDSTGGGLTRQSLDAKWDDPLHHELTFGYPECKGSPPDLRFAQVRCVACSCSQSRQGTVMLVKATGHLWP